MLTDSNAFWSGRNEATSGIKKYANQRFAVVQLAGQGEPDGLGERGGAYLNVLVLVGSPFSRGMDEVFGEQDVHGLGDEAGAGVVVHKTRPFLRAVAGLFQ